MSFLQLTLAVGPADPEPFEDALFAAGALSVTLEDAADNPVLEPAPGTTPLWPSVRVKALFEANADRDVIRVLLQDQLGSSLPALEFDSIADRAWEREWLKDFRPMQFGRRLWICPDGQRPSLTDEDAGAAVFIDLDPGLAFGTGTHPTTSLCLQWLEGADLAGKTVIDYGCGSGILAIAALKLGAASALAVDIDPQAILATRENAVRNDVSLQLTAMTVAEMPHTAADVVLANILAEPLLQLAPDLAALTKPEGAIVLSGILSEQAAQVATRYRAWFHIAPVHILDGWARIDGVRNREQR